MDHVYFPDLTKIFGGDARVFSWTRCYQSLRRKCFDDQCIEALLQSSTAKSLLSQIIPKFNVPSAQSRSAFDTSTANIKLPSTLYRTCDVEQCKNDALWLSREVNLSEEECLRVVVLEWHLRPTLRLDAGYSEAELASLRDAFGSGDGIGGDEFSHMFPARSEVTFDKEPQRRKRILAVYNEEQISLLRVYSDIYQAKMDTESPLNTNTNRRQLNQINTRQTKPIDDELVVLDAIDACLHKLDQSKLGTLEVEGIDDIWLASSWRQSSILLEHLLVILHESVDKFIDNRVILRWFHLSTSCDFFRQIVPSALFPVSAIERLQAVASLISVAVLRSSLTLSTLTEPYNLENRFFLSDPEIVTEIHGALFSLAEEGVVQAAPAALAWAIILNELRLTATRAKDSREETRLIEQPPPSDLHLTRRSSHGSLQQTFYEELIEDITTNSPMTDPVTYLLRCMLEANHALLTIASLAGLVAEQPSMLKRIGLELLQELVSVSIATVGYSPDTLCAQFAILEASSNDAMQVNPDMAGKFIHDDFLMENLFAVAVARFPYEALPFLRLCRLLAQARVFDNQGTQYITYRLRSMESFTYPAINQYTNYRTIREDENMNLVALQNLAYMPGYLGQSRLLSDAETTLIPSGTIGEVVSETIPAVIRWQHSYSGLSYLGTFLFQYYYGQLQSIISPSEPAEDIAAEVVHLVSILLLNVDAMEDDSKSRSSSHRRQSQESILKEFSYSLDEETDVVYYICEIMEQEVQAFRYRPVSTFNTTLLVACVTFLTALIDVRPAQFWSCVRKSSLFGSAEGDNMVVALSNSVEASSRNYPLSIACARLLAKTVDVCLTEYRTSNFEATVSTTNSLVSYTLKAQAHVLHALTSSAYGIFESLPSWPFSSAQQQIDMIDTIARSFERIIFYSSETGESPRKSNLCFHSSAQFLWKQSRLRLDEQASTTPTLLHLCRLVNSGSDLSDNAKDSVYQSLLNLCQALIHPQLGDNTPISSMEAQLFDAVPLLCRILVTEDESMNSHIRLLQDLLEIVARARPVSLLGHLGSTSSLCLLSFLADSVRGSSVGTETVVWDFLTSLIGRNQQWLAITILSGQPPEKVNSTANLGIPNEKKSSVLSIALAKAIKIGALSKEVAVSIVDFLVRAQQNWPWIADSLQSEKNLLPALVSYITDVFHEPSAVLKLAYRNKIAAAITDFSTIYFHYATAIRDQVQIKTTLSLMEWLSDNAVSVSSYNTSLHGNLRKNFARKFDGLDIMDIAKQRTSRTAYGEQFFYDIDYANRLLAHEPYWNKRTGNQEQSFAAECRRANLNLSLVDSEVLLFRSFKAFYVEHREWLSQQHEEIETPEIESHQAILVQIVQHCLQNNMREHPQQRLFEGLLQSRAELAISILQSLVHAKAKGFDVKALLKTSWDCARFRNSSYEQALTDGNITYWRTMITIVLLSLSFHAGGKWLPPVADHSNANLLRHSINDQNATILDISTVIVGDGLKSVVVAIQDQQRSNTATGELSPVTTQDLTLILTTLETILRISRAAEYTSDLSQRLVSSGAIQSCMLLYSWSHVLAPREPHDQTGYAEVSLRFLSLLSSLPPVAEEMAVEGVLGRLLNARMTQKLQKVSDGASQLDSRPGVSILYQLWASSILQMCLNLVHSVGAPVAGEVSQFLNQFPKQLDRASTVFMAGGVKSQRIGHLTLSIVEEAATIALLSFTLNTYRIAGASAGVDSLEIMPLQGYDEQKKALADDITELSELSSSDLSSLVIATNEKEMKLSKQETDGSNQLVKRFRHQLKRALLCLQSPDTVNEER